MATRDAPGAARRFVFETLHDWRHQRVVADAELIVSELATNSVIHGHSNFTVAIAASDNVVRISVIDNSSVLPKPCQPLLNATGGRGLQIVNALAARWSAESRPHGKVVWAELASRPR
jgi:anti-sigma regulatory factor (Ser/Thr protein kinase)